MNATVRSRTGWDGLSSFGRLSPPTVTQPGIRCDGRAGPTGRPNHSAWPPMIRSEDTRTSTWVFVEHLQPRHGLLNGRRPEDDLRKAPNAQRIYAGPVRTVRDHSAEQHSVESRGSDRAGGIGGRDQQRHALISGQKRRRVQGRRADEHRPGLAVVVASRDTQNGEGVDE
jgi:hypothetical protein